MGVLGTPRFAEIYCPISVNNYHIYLHHPLNFVLRFDNVPSAGPPAIAPLIEIQPIGVINPFNRQPRMSSTEIFTRKMRAEIGESEFDLK